MGKKIQTQCTMYMVVGKCEWVNERRHWRYALRESNNIHSGLDGWPGDVRLKAFSQACKRKFKLNWPGRTGNIVLWKRDLVFGVLRVAFPWQLTPCFPEVLAAFTIAIYKEKDKGFVPRALSPQDASSHQCVYRLHVVPLPATCVVCDLPVLCWSD